jgi:hypothetical protein
MPLCIFTLENKKYYIKQYQQDLIDSITNMVEKLNNPELFLNTLKPTVQNISWIIENPIISYKIVNTEKLEDTTVQLMKQFGMQSTRSDLCPDAYINFEESEYLRGRINEEEQPVMDRIAILDGQIEVLKDVNTKLDVTKYTNITKKFLKDASEKETTPNVLTLCDSSVYPVVKDLMEEIYDDIQTKKITHREMSNFENVEKLYQEKLSNYLIEETKVPEVVVTQPVTTPVLNG